MLLLKLCTIAFHTILIHGLIYPEHPILDVNDKKGGVPVDLLKSRGDLDNVGLVIHKNSVSKLTTSTLGNNFKNGDYYPKPPNQQLSLCTPLDKERAVFLAGTGFVVGTCQFATSLHVVQCLINPETVKCNPQQEVTPTAKNVKDIRIVFNFISSPSSKTGTLKTATYSVNGIVSMDAKRDLIILTAQTFNHAKPKPPPFRLEDQHRLPVKGQKVYMLGHPLGRTMRYTTGQVISADPKGGFSKFVISGFSGNSGSPIIDAESGDVLGLFAFYNDDENKVDFERNTQKNCYVFRELPRGQADPNRAAVQVSGPPAWVLRPNANIKCPPSP